MRRLVNIVGLWAAVVAVAASGTAVLAQGPGGAPGMPAQRLGPSRGQGAGVGTPGAPMARMGRGGGMPQASAPSGRSYRGMAGVPGIMSSRQFRSSTYANQARNGGGMMRSSAGIISSATRGAASLPASPR